MLTIKIWYWLSIQMTCDFPDILYPLNISDNIWKQRVTLLVHLTLFSLIDIYCQQLPLTLILSSSSPAPPTVPSFLLSLPWLLADVPYRPVLGPSVRESNSHPAIIRFAGVATVSVSNFASVSLACNASFHLFYILTLIIYHLLRLCISASLSALWFVSCHRFTLCSCSLPPEQKRASVMEQINQIASQGPAKLEKLCFPKTNPWN